MFSTKSLRFLEAVRGSGVLQIPCCTIIRGFSTKDLKKFYKNATITETEGKFEINLDKKKLKTPGGSVFRVPNEALALTVAHEWNTQKDTIKRLSMHMTNLCSAAIDNPMEQTKESYIKHILQFLDTDTICYRVEEPVEMAELAGREWDPLLHWIQERYGVEIKPTSGIGVPHVPEETLTVFRKHLLSFNEWALVGYVNAVEILKSLIITMATVDRLIEVEKAVTLSRLEQEFQISRWGNVEWYHDQDLAEQRARLAAAILFVHLNSMDTRVSFNKADAGLPV